MEQYDEHMNYSFEPMQEQPTMQQPPVQPTQPTEDLWAEKPKKQKKNHTGLKLTALIVAVALVAGTAGVLLSGTIRGIANREAGASAQTPQESETETAQIRKPEESQTPAKYELQKTKLPDKLPSLEGDKSLTPKEVYKMNVGACCGILSETATSGSSGSGFVITQDGYVVTNYHVVDNGEKLTVNLYDGTSYEAVMVGGDEQNDVALLKIEAEGLQCVYIGDSDTMEVGDEVIAIGNPLGGLNYTMTQGYISGLNREITLEGTLFTLMQTDVAINSGNSGGALFDMNGNVVGVTNAKYSGTSSTGAGIEGIGFSIPINDVMKIVYDLQEYGYVRGRAYLGVTLRDLDTATASSYGLPVGPIVQTVAEGTCAEKAGLQPQDIIIAFNGEEIENYTQLTALLRKCSAGDTATMTVFRGGAKLDLELVLDERPEDFQSKVPAEDVQMPDAQTPGGSQQAPSDGNQQAPSDGSGTFPWGDSFDPYEFFRYFYGYPYGN